MREEKGEEGVMGNAPSQDKHAGGGRAGRGLSKSPQKCGGSQLKKERPQSNGKTCACFQRPYKENRRQKDWLMGTGVNGSAGGKRDNVPRPHAREGRCVGEG